MGSANAQLAGPCFLCWPLSSSKCLIISLDMLFPSKSPFDGVEQFILKIRFAWSGLEDRKQEEEKQNS